MPQHIKSFITYLLTSDEKILCKKLVFVKTNNITFIDIVGCRPVIRIFSIFNRSKIYLIQENVECIFCRLRVQEMHLVHLLKLYFYDPQQALNHGNHVVTINVFSISEF